MEIFCEAESQPTEWDKSWTHEEVKVYWKGQWKYNSKGEPVAK